MSCLKDEKAEKEKINGCYDDGYVSRHVRAMCSEKRERRRTVEQSEAFKQQSSIRRNRYRGGGSNRQISGRVTSFITT